ncbi:AEC family transporter [Candidatus Falkowbacteria bacterium]|nr:AEC family transporter [Candidatus Falkowbacteria bacterium]
MLQIFLMILPLFLIIFGTAIIQYYKKVDEQWSRILNAFALKVGLPALIFSALAKNQLSLTAGLETVIANSLFILGCFVAAYAIIKVFRLNQAAAKTIFICLAFSNIAYLGLPILLQMNGVRILPLASLIVAVYLFWVFTVGLGFLDYHQPGRNQRTTFAIGRRLITNPIILAIIAGLALSALQITLPTILLQPIEMISAAVTPTVLIVIGLFIGSSRLGKMKDWLPVIVFSLARLLILPAVLYFSLRLLGYTSEHFAASIIQAAMPLAISPFALADEFDLDKNFIARSIVLSTALAIFSIPFWVSIL